MLCQPVKYLRNAVDLPDVVRVLFSHITFLLLSNRWEIAIYLVHDKHNLDLIVILVKIDKSTYKDCFVFRDLLYSDLLWKLCCNGRRQKSLAIGSD